MATRPQLAARTPRSHLTEVVRHRLAALTVLAVVAVGLGLGPPAGASPTADARQPSQASQRRGFLPSALRNYADVYYRATFDGPTCEWSQFQNDRITAGCADGTFVYRFITASTDYSASIWANVSASDYEVSADLRFDPYDGQAGSSPSAYGLGETGLVFGDWLFLVSNANNGYYAHLYGGYPRFGGSYSVPNTGVPIESGAWQRLKARRQGTTVAIYLNGALLQSIQDPRARTGPDRLGTYQGSCCASRYPVFRWDNVGVYPVGGVPT